MGGLLNNAVGWAIFRRRGGWTTVLLSGATAAAVLVAMFLLLSRVANRPTLPNWTTPLLVGQSFVLVLLGSVAAGKYARLDVNGKQLESHRLMPLNAVWTAAGYAIGPNGGVLAAAAVIFVAGLAVNILQPGGSPQHWIVANVMLLLFAWSAWIAAALTPFIGKLGGFLVGAIVAAIWFSQGALLKLLPGLSMVVSPLIGPTVFNRAIVAGGLSWPIGLAALCQVLLAIALLLGVARRFRADDQPVVSVRGGVALMALLAGFSSVALAFEDKFTSRAGPIAPNVAEPIQTAATILMLALVGVIPLLAAAQAAIVDKLRAAAGDDRKSGRAWRGSAVLIATIVLTLLPLAWPRIVRAAPDRAWVAPVYAVPYSGRVDVPGGFRGESLVGLKAAPVISVLAVAGHAVLLWGIASILAAVLRSPGGLVAVATILLSTVPILLDAILAGLSDQDPNLGSASVFSLTGLILRAWNGTPPPATQTLLACGAWAAVGVMLTALAKRITARNAATLARLVADVAPAR